MKKLLLVSLIFLLGISFVLANIISSDDFECGAFDCGEGWNSKWEYIGGCIISAGFNPIDNFHMIGENECNALRLFNDSNYNKVLLSFYTTSPNLRTEDHCLFYYNNGEKDFLLLDLTGSDIDGKYRYYQFDITGYGLTNGAGFKFVNPKDNFCIIDNVVIDGTSNNQLNIFMKDSYILGSTEKIEMSSSLINTAHKIELYDDKNNMFCQDTIISPSSPFTSFFTKCTMPTIQQNNAYAKLYKVTDSSILTIKYFTVMPVIQNTTNLQIKKVYFSPQVLQGGSTEIFVLLQKDPNITITTSSISLTFPDGTTRDLSLSPTSNLNEYRAFITDTYQVGNVSFTLKISDGRFYDSYVGYYTVAAYNVNFVDVVNKVSEVAICKKVEEIPRQSLELSGTEYSPGDLATIFLQLKDNFGNPVTNGACWLDVWYPLNSTNYHPYITQNAPMLKALGNTGIYYYDTIAPSILGVYMLGAKCSYLFDWIWIFPEDENVKAPISERTSGTWSGDTLALNSRTDSNFERCDATALTACVSNYTFNILAYGVITNITTINLYYAGQGDVAGKTVTFAYWNGTAFINLVNTWVTVATGATATLPGGIDQFTTNIIPLSALYNNETLVKIRITTPTGLARYYNNWFSIALLSSTGTIQDLKGSSEMHITNIPNSTAIQLWTYPNRTLTNYSEQTIANFIWNNNVRNLTYYQDVTNYTLINQGVWSYINRTLTNAPENTTAIANAVWSATYRNLTYYPAVNETSIANAMWGYTGTIATNILEQLANIVWQYLGGTKQII